MTSPKAEKLPACISLKRLSLSGAPPSIPPVAGSELYGTQTGGAYTSYNQYAEHQERSRWCWAAVASSMGNYYWPSEEWNQERIVRLILHGTLSNVGHELPPALQLVATLKQVVMGSMPAVQELRNELVMNHPFAVKIAPKKSRPNTHVLGIGALDYLPLNGTTVPMWWVCDPWPAQSNRWVAVNDFPSRYPEDPGSDWIETYYTMKGNA